MDTPIAKRRRPNNKSALHKPFKSPFRTPLKSKANPPDTPPSSDGPDSAARQPADDRREATTESISAQLRPGLVEPSLPVHTLKSILRTRASNPSFHTAFTPQSASVTARTTQLRSTVNTLKQAIQLLEHPEGDEALEELTHKWRAASRAAAEELFATSRDRVNRMGGVGAWKERERDQRKKMLDWEEEALQADDIGATTDEDDEDEDEEDDEGRKLTREERDMKKEAKREMRKMLRERKEMDKEVMRQRRKEEENKAEVVKEDEGFTMDMMLKTLNVELDVIGYSKERSQWVGFERQFS